MYWKYTSKSEYPKGYKYPAGINIPCLTEVKDGYNTRYEILYYDLYYNCWCDKDTYRSDYDDNVVKWEYLENIISTLTVNTLNNEN